MELEPLVDKATLPLLGNVINGSVGAITAAAFVAEGCFERIQVFERRGSAGGTWFVDLASFGKADGS